MDDKTLFKTINEHRIRRHLSIKAFAEELGVGYHQAYNTLLRGTVPRDFNREPYDRYYRKHKSEINHINQ